MKKYLSFTFVLVLTAALFTGCGCTSQDAKYTTAPATMPTVMTTAPTTETTHATTEATTPTADHGNGPLDGTTHTESTASTNETTENHARSASPTTKN